ncbi:MAG: hypothetical protein K2P95_07035, partial [Hyphomonadaceae bacterium]|nr:hypothetical protein [Hyphomonadaceae bacterium]
MKMTSKRTYVLAALLAVATLSVSDPAEARRGQDARKERQTSRQNAAPITRSNHVNTQRGNFSRTSEADVASDGQSAFRSRTVIGPDGQS